MVAIEALSRRANVEHVDAGPKGIVLAFRDNVFVDPNRLIAPSSANKAVVCACATTRRTRKDQQLVFFDDWPLPQDRLKGTAAVLRKLASIAEQAKAA